MAAADRDKALETALAQIERQFGKGSIMRLGDDDRPPIESIPTGAISLDVALGIGGLPRGRIVEIYGPESSGKCLTADTYVWTDRGLETVAEIFERAGQPVVSADRVTDVRGHGIRVVNERGELERVAALTHNGRKPVLRITVASGRTVRVTRNHPLRVMDEDGAIIWREAGEIRKGDTVVSAGFGAVEAASGSGLSEDEAVLLGYLTAGRALDDADAIRFSSRDAEVGAEFTALATWLLDAEVETRREADRVEYVLPGAAVRADIAERYGAERASATGGRVPYRVRTAGDKAQRAFLSALYESDGRIDASSGIGLATASEQLARDVQQLLYGLGVPASLHGGSSREDGQGRWSVAVDPSAAHRFRDEIGFRSARRAARAEEGRRALPRGPRFEDIPNIAGLIQELGDSVGADHEFDQITGDFLRGGTAPRCGRDRLARIVRWAEGRPHRTSAATEPVLDRLRELASARYTYETVIGIDDAGLQPTFDIMVPGTHSFLANGVLSHNTTVALHAVASAQRLGGIAAFVDAEHALDPSYAKKIGVNTDDLLLSQPDTGEQALEIVDMLIRSGAVSIIVIDSVAALVPRAEIEGEMGDSHVGLQARLMSQALRKIAGALHQTNTTAIFINQLREKVGVMFGCMSYDTPVTLADGSQEKIGAIVDQKMGVEVLSYDPEADRVVPRRIVNWFDNGEAEYFLRFTVGGSGEGGAARFDATPNHLVRTPGGWRAAGELAAGDRVLVNEAHHLSDQQRQLVYGAVMGGGSLSPAGAGHGGARLRMAHSVERAAYLDWKVSLLSNIGHSRAPGTQRAASVEFAPLPELDELRQVVHFGDASKHLTWEFLKELSPLALAVWYMDSGHFTPSPQDGGRIEVCVDALSPGSRNRLVDHLRHTHGLDVRLAEPGAAGKTTLVFGAASSARFMELVAPHVPEPMAHKLLPRFRGRYATEPESVEPVQKLVAAPVLDIRVGPRTGDTRRFDIEVEGNHNYFVDGVMVHNSPETTSGGRALKFYASVRLDVRRIETLKDGSEAVGNRTRVRVVKNKIAPPFKQAEFDILYGVGVSREGGLIDLGVENGIVRKSGAWYTYETTQLGQGKENARNFLRENADMANEIEKRIKEKLGIPTGGTDGAAGEEAKDAAAPAPAATKRAPRRTAAETKASPAAKRTPAADA